MLCGKLCWIEEEEEEWVEYIPSALRVCAYYTQRNGQRSAQWSGVNEGGQVVCVVCRSWRPSSPLYFYRCTPERINRGYMRHILGLLKISRHLFFLILAGIVSHFDVLVEDVKNWGEEQWRTVHYVMGAALTT